MAKPRGKSFTKGEDPRCIHGQREQQANDLSVRMFGSGGKKRANASSNCAALYGADLDACWRGLPGGRTDGDEKLAEITMKA